MNIYVFDFERKSTFNTKVNLIKINQI